MTSNLNAAGLSARQKINFNFNNLFWALLILLILLLTSVVSTRGQARESQNIPPAKPSHKPEVEIKVNHHYDNQGNTIGYDSIYTSFYSSAIGDTLGMQRMMRSLNQNFAEGRFPFFKKPLDQLFSIDTTLFAPLPPHGFYKDPCDHDFFLQNHEIWQKFIEDMTHRLDSLKNGFIYEERKRGHKF